MSQKKEKKTMKTSLPDVEEFEEPNSDSKDVAEKDENKSITDSFLQNELTRIASQTDFNSVKPQIMDYFSWMVAGLLFDMFRNNTVSKLEFIARAEEYLFSKEEAERLIDLVENGTQEQAEEAYNELIGRRTNALNSIYALMDFTRKFMKDHADHLISPDDELRGELTRKLARLDKRTLNQALTIVKRLIENE